MFTDLLDSFYYKYDPYYTFYDNKDHYSIEIELPGSTDLKVKAYNSKINISGNKKGKEFHYLLRLNDDVNVENINSKYKDGILFIKIFKKELYREIPIEYA